MAQQAKSLFHAIDFRLWLVRSLRHTRLIASHSLSHLLRCITASVAHRSDGYINSHHCASSSWRFERCRDWHEDLSQAEFSQFFIVRCSNDALESAPCSCDVLSLVIQKYSFWRKLNMANASNKNQVSNAENKMSAINIVDVIGGIGEGGVAMSVMTLRSVFNAVQATSRREDQAATSVVWKTFWRNWSCWWSPLPWYVMCKRAGRIEKLNIKNSKYLIRDWVYTVAVINRLPGYG